MTTRGIGATHVTETGKSYVRPVYFAAIDFPSGAVNVHTRLGTYIHNGRTFTGIGDFGGMEAVSEGEQLGAYPLELRLSGLSATIAAEAAAQEFVGAPVTMYLGFLDSTNLLVATPFEFWSGFAEQMSVLLSKEASIRMTCESELSILDKANGKLYTQADIQQEFPGDTFFDYLSALQERTFRWAEMRPGQTGTPLNGTAASSAVSSINFRTAGFGPR